MEDYPEGNQMVEVVVANRFVMPSQRRDQEYARYKWS